MRVKISKTNTLLGVDTNVFTPVYSFYKNKFNISILIGELS